MNYKRVAVLRGGPGEEYLMSMQSGAAVLGALRDLAYPVTDIVVTRSGAWLQNGIERKPEQALQAIDIVFVALHNPDGDLQRLLQRLAIPFTGSNALTSRIASNKILAKDTLRKSGVKMPAHRKVTRSDMSRIDLVVQELNKALGEELFIKPVNAGSSVGARYVPNQGALRRELGKLLNEFEELIIEEFIRGKEASVSVLEGYRQQPVYTLPAVEIVPPAGEPLYSFEHKFSDQNYEVCPGRFSYHEKSKLEDIARLVHESLSCDHYSKTDFIIRDGDVFFLEVNTTPSVSRNSTFLSALDSVGMSYNEFIDFLVKTAKR